MNVEYVDRYTDTLLEGRPWLRGCWGDCEAIGAFPVYVGGGPKGKHIARTNVSTRDRLLVDKARREGRLLTLVDEHGYAWVQCEDCHGTGNVGRLTAAKRLPRLFSKLASGLRHAHGSEGWPPSVRFPKLKTRAWYLKYTAIEVYRAFTWEDPSGKG